MNKYFRLYNTIVLLALMMTCFAACTGKKDPGTNETQQLVGPAFNADSAYAFCEAQCAFGPRDMNSEAHEKCAAWIAATFERFGCEVTLQKADIKGWDGKTLKCTNIIASTKPDKKERILICAHWDSRPWADNDPDKANHHTPVMAANDGASGVAVMLEIARLLQANDSTNLGIDFICFDAEDYGVPRWGESSDQDSWALGAQYWSKNPHKTGYSARFGILLDMVGGQGAKFYQEGMSMAKAPSVVDKVWTAAEIVGYGSMFPREEGGYITDDHGPINDNLGIPTIDIIPFYPDCEQSNFGPTWHTLTDDMAHIDRNTLKAVGQTVIQVLYSEER